jgi:hypothetical protein
VSAVATTRPFVTALRSRPGLVRLGDGSPRLTVRIELQERWETLAFDVSADSTVHALKGEALSRFGLAEVPAEDFILKLRGAEIVDEQETLTAATVRDGSSFLLSFRRRRPVR